MKTPGSRGRDAGAHPWRGGAVRRADRKPPADTTAAPVIQAPPTPPSPPDYPRGRISGYMFGDLYYNLDGDPTHVYSAAGGDAGQINIDGAKPITQDLNGIQLRQRLLPARQRSLVQSTRLASDSRWTARRSPPTGRSGVRQERLPAGEERRPARRFLLRDDQHADLRERRGVLGLPLDREDHRRFPEAWLRPRTLACR